jgi:hypothetical protein
MDIRKSLPADTMIFSGHSYDNSIIGMTFDGRAIYSFELMVEELMEDEKWAEQDAIDWIEYNIIRAIPYFRAKAPIVVYSAY